MGHSVTFEDPVKCPDFAKFDMAIVVGGLLRENKIPGLSIEPEVARREREIFAMLDSGRTVCILAAFADDPLLLRIAERTGVYLVPSTDRRTDLKVKRSEFKKFIQSYGASTYVILGETGVTISTMDGIKTMSRISGLGWSEYPGGMNEYYEKDLVVGFSKKVSKGIMILVPFQLEVREGEPNYPNEMIGTLLDAVTKHVASIRSRPPKWVEELQLPQESNLLKEMDDLKKKESKIEEQLENYRDLRKILWSRGNELDDELRAFLGNFGVETRKDEKFEEDFWILEQAVDTVIVEVKGKDKNLDRFDISKLDEHRAASQKPKDFPALMIVNSFNVAQNLSEKDVAISPNEIEKAFRDNVLIVRTLDLLRTYALLEKKNISKSELVEILKKRKGWLEVTDSGYRVHDK